MMVSGKTLVDQRYVSALMMLIFGLGTFTLVALVVGAFLVVVYVLNLALTATIDVVSHVMLLYAGLGSFGQLAVWLVVIFFSYKYFPHIAKVAWFRRVLLRFV